MRIRLQLLLPLALGLVVALAVAAAAAMVGGAVADALMTVPGVTAQRAREAAVRAVTIWGVAAVVITVLASVLIARMVAVPLERMRRAAEEMPERDRADAGGPTPVAELQDVARGLSRAGAELRDRHAREVRERTELAALVEAVSEGILKVDAEGRVVRVNRAARELLALPPDAPGRAAAAVVRSPELRHLLLGSAEGGGRTAEIVVDDRRLLVSVAFQPEGGAVATVLDLTDLRRLEEVRRDFVANASHELKTPLTSIRGYTETLLSGDLPPAEQRQFLGTISRNAERLQRIVDDLLDLSRLEAGRWRPELEPIDVVEAARACWSSFHERAAAQGVDFAATAEDARPAIADRRGLEQVFANLFDNALRYTPGDGRVRVVARAGPAPARAAVDGVARSHAAGSPPGNGGPWVVVEVADTGAGIPRDALPRIFERFYRVDPARSRAEGGTGLGLSIVKHMVETMGGAITASSELGKGTTIRIWLPAA